MLPVIKNQIAKLFHKALEQIASQQQIDGEIPAIQLERPKVAEHGDLACNVAMQLARSWKMNPRDLATQLIANISSDPSFSEFLSDIQIAGPGFINLRVAARAKQAVITQVLSEGRVMVFRRLIIKKSCLSLCLPTLLVRCMWATVDKQRLAMLYLI